MDGSSVPGMVTRDAAGATAPPPQPVAPEENEGGVRADGPSRPDAQLSMPVCDARQDAGDTCTPVTGSSCGASCADGLANDASSSTPASCTPGPEVCNWRDDDCDGVADPEMIVPPARPHVHTQRLLVGEPDRPPPVHAAVVVRAGGGGWLAYREMDRGESRISIKQIGAEGSPSTTPVDNVRTEGAESFATASQGRWAAIVSGVRPLQVGNSVDLRLQVYRSDDLRLVTEMRIAEHRDDDAMFDQNLPDPDRCVEMWPLAVAVLDRSEVTRVAVVYARTARGTLASDGSLVCSGAPSVHMRVATQIPSGQWRMEAPLLLAQFEWAWSVVAAIVSSPCSDEWLVAHSTGSLQRMSGEGRPLETVLSLKDASSVDVAVSPECASGGAPFGVIYDAERTPVPNVGNSLRLVLRAGILQPGASLSLGASHEIAPDAYSGARLLYSRGRWFTVALLGRGLGLLEKVEKTQGAARLVWSVSGDAPGPAVDARQVYAALQRGPGMFDVEDVGSAIVVLTGTMTGRDTAVENGNGRADLPVAFTYPFTCM